MFVAVGDDYHKIHLRLVAVDKEVIIVDVLKRIDGDYLLMVLQNL